MDLFAEETSGPSKVLVVPKPSAFAKILLGKTPKQAEVKEPSMPPSKIAARAPAKTAKKAAEAPVAEPAEEPAQSAPAKARAKPKSRPLPRNKSLYAMRDLQRSNRPILKNLTIHKIVKKFTREGLLRADIKYSRPAMQALMRIVEQMIYEQLLSAHQLCLSAGRRTLMLHHLESGAHRASKPNPGHWTVADFEQEEARLEPSRFPRSRLSEA